MIEEMILEGALNATNGLIGFLDPYAGQGIGLAVGTVIGWISRSAVKNIFMRGKTT